MIRPRRFRQNKAIRSLLQETTLQVNDLILPVFVHDQIETVDISSLSGHHTNGSNFIIKILRINFRIRN